MIRPPSWLSRAPKNEQSNFTTILQFTLCFQSNNEWWLWHGLTESQIFAILVAGEKFKSAEIEQIEVEAKR